jgi:hypothetical protein
MTDSPSSSGVPAPGQPEPEQRELLEARCERLTRRLLDSGLLLTLGRQIAEASGDTDDAS